MLITGQLSIDMLSGPVGIYDFTDQVVQMGFYNYLMWTAMLSINLGVINLVPLPALDGGRLLFIAIEAVPWETDRSAKRRNRPCYRFCIYLCY